MKKLVIVKIGGSVFENNKLLHKTLKKFSQIQHSKILVHGGGKIASLYLQQLGITPCIKNGRRITDAESLTVIQMVYAGLINKTVVTSLQSLDCNAIGLCGSDINSILAKKRESEKINFGFVGDICWVNSESIANLIKLDLTPVFCALTHDGKGQILNTNADTVAAELAIALSSKFRVELIYCSDKAGVLTNIDDEKSVVLNLTNKQYIKLKRENKIKNGMIPKLDNAFSALLKGVQEVRIINFLAMDESNQYKLNGTTILL